jgi:hypothetical protein
MNKVYRVRDGVSFTREAVERALNLHQVTGYIKAWRALSTDTDKGTRTYPIYEVTLTNGDTLGLANMWEAHAFVNGIATARQAQQRKDSGS